MQGLPARHHKCSGLSCNRRSVHLTSRRLATSSASAVSTTVPTRQGLLDSQWWTWRGHRIRYQQSGPSDGVPVILVHGFGGNADHWRKNTPELGKMGYNTYSLDLLGYGFSDKPNPKLAPPNTVYCFANWGAQLTDFIQEVVGNAPVFLICNSVGGLAGLEASIQRPDLVQGVQLLNISLRGLHVKRIPEWRRPLVAGFQQVLRDTDLGKAFFASVAKPQTVKRILSEAYANKNAVTDELVDCILKPGLQPGAVDVFLDFISYSGGPLPEELIASTTRPISIVWGEKDPWEDLRLAKLYFGNIPTVKEFITLPGVGHCPQDEAPDKVNPLIDAFCKKYGAAS